LHQRHSFDGSHRAKEAAVSFASRRFAFTAAVVMLLSPLVFAEDATPKQIAQWIQQLGDDRFTVRENASKQLWQAGAAAEVALEQAIKSDDAEVVRRVRELLDKFRWGIYPDTPADIVAQIRVYRSGEGNTRVEAFEKLLDGGDKGMRAVLKIVAAERSAEHRRVLQQVLTRRLPDAFQSAVKEGKYEYFESLLELGHEGKLFANNQYVAYWLLRGKHREILARYEQKLKTHPNDQWTAQTLVYLYRANDDLESARKAAEKCGDERLLEGILQELGDWQALAARTFKDEEPIKRTDNTDPFGEARSHERVERWAFRAAYQRLAGKQKDFEKAANELQKIAVEEVDRDPRAFIAAKGLLLNDRPEDGLEILKTIPDRQSLVFDILCARLRYKEALAWEPKPAADAKKIPRLDFARARILCVLGEKEGEARFKRFGEMIKDNIDAQWVQALLEEEYRAGLIELAFTHAGKAMSVRLPPGTVQGYDGLFRADEMYITQLFPQESSTARNLWGMLRTNLFNDKTNAITLKRLRDLMEGKIPAKEVKTWIEQAETLVTKSANSTDRLADQRRALAEIAIKVDLHDLAVSLLDKADSHAALIRLGDLLAEKKQWEKAAERYHRAWKKQSTPKRPQGLAFSEDEANDPLPLYLAGDALVHAGQEAEGKKLMERAHWLPLAEVAVRHRFLRALAERGHTAAARRETDLLRRVSEPNTYYSGAAIRRLSIAALQRKDYLKAAHGFEQSMLRCLHSYASFVSPAGYINVPAQVHQLRARGLLGENKIEEALRQADLALNDAPGYVDVPISLVPALEGRGRDKEATQLYERCRSVYEKVCRDYPRCAWAHNSVAWMNACCKRRLDEALTHAERAVELAPSNAGYRDTLAEVHFQRGDKNKAVAAQKRAIELDPKKVYYRKQLKRLEAGDPKAERPPESEEE
jgi:tetratricopeptide (TPR) repeat protein